MSSKKNKVTRHLSAIDNAASGVLMSGLLVKKGKRSYLSTARHCALTRDCFVYSSGDVRRVPVLNMQVSVARESFTLVDCSEESFTFRCLGKSQGDRERDVQKWTQTITQARDAQVLVRKGVLKQGKNKRDAVLVTVWLTSSCIITAEPFKTGATVIFLRSVAEILPVPLQPALIMHTKTGKSLRLVMSTEKHQREWINLISDCIRRAKAAGDVDAFGDNNVMPQDIEAEMQFDALVKQMRAAVVALYEKFAPPKAAHVDEFLEQYSGREELLFANLAKKYGQRPEFNLLELEKARERMQQLQQQEDAAHHQQQQQQQRRQGGAAGSPGGPAGGGGGGGGSGKAAPPPLPAMTARVRSPGTVQGGAGAAGAAGGAGAARGAGAGPGAGDAGTGRPPPPVAGARSAAYSPSALPPASPAFKPPHEQKCNCCFRNFTFTTRRHHCRCCNRAVCHSCSGMREATERMHALTSTPTDDDPDPALLAKLVNISLSELNPAVQHAQHSSSQPRQQQQQQQPLQQQQQRRQQQRQTPDSSHWREIRRSWQAAMDEGVKIRICDGCLEDTQNDLMDCWDSLSIKPETTGILEKILEETRTKKSELEVLL